MMKLVATAAFLAFASPALATPIIITNVQAPGTEILTVDAPNSAPLNAYVGRVTLTTSTGATLRAWCIDLLHEVYIGSGQQLPYTTGSFTTDNDGHTLSTKQKDEIAGLITIGDKLLASHQATTSDSAATQLAIWSVEYPTFTYSGASARTVAETDRLLTLAPSLVGRADALVALAGQQTLATEVDAPASIALLLAGLPGLIWLRRQRG